MQPALQQEAGRSPALRMESCCEQVALGRLAGPSLQQLPLPLFREGSFKGMLMIPTKSSVGTRERRMDLIDPRPAPQGSRVVTEGPPCLRNSRSSLCGDEEECISTHNPDPGRGGSPRNGQATPGRASACSCALGSPRGQGRGLGVGERAGSPPHTAETFWPSSGEQQ